MLKAVGVLGADAVAAVNNATRIFFVFQSIIFGLVTGSAALVSQATGASNQAETGRTIMVSLVCGCVLSLFISVAFLLFSEELAGSFRTSDSIREGTATFLFWSGFFPLAYTLMIVMSTVLRAAGDARTPLWLGACTHTITIALVFALVDGWFGLPAYGIAGPAIAQGVGFSIGGLAFLGMWLFGRLRIAPMFKGWMSYRRLKDLFGLANPAIVEGLLFNGGLFVYVWLIAAYGSAANAAYGIGVQVLLLSILIGVGFQVASSTLVGQYIGAWKPSSAYRTGWRCMRYAIYTMSGFSILLIALAEPLTRFLIDDDEVVANAVVFIYMLGAMQPLMAIEFTMSGALRGAGDTRSPFLITVSTLFLRLVLAMIAVWMELGVVWLYAALIADYILKAVLYILRYRSGRWTRTARKRGLNFKT